MPRREGDIATQKFRAEEVGDALRATRGVKKEAARRLGCARGTIDAYMKRYTSVQEAFVEARNMLVDDAETALGEMIDAREWQAVRYTLSTLGKDRGYGEAGARPAAEAEAEPERGPAAEEAAGGLAEFEATILRIYGEDAEAVGPEDDP